MGGIYSEIVWVGRSIVRLCGGIYSEIVWMGRSIVRLGWGDL